MLFENFFDVQAAPSEVVRAFMDVPLITSFFPGASVGAADEDGGYPGELVVSFGPKRIVFKGTLKNDVYEEEWRGRMVGTAGANVRGTKMSVTLDYSIQPIEDSATPASRVHLVSDAVLSGMLAEFAKTGGVALTEALLDQFAQRFSAYLQNTVSSPAHQTQVSHPKAQENSLKLSAVLGIFLRSWGRRLRAFFGI